MTAMNCIADVLEDAKNMALEFVDEIVEKLCDDGEASDDLLNDYGSGDSYHHESHTDKDYDLLEAAELLDQLSDFEETDSGLWEGCEPRKAITCQAAYTFGNAVMSKWQTLVQELNENEAIGGLKDAYEATELDGVKDLLKQAIKLQVKDFVESYDE